MLFGALGQANDAHRQAIYTKVLGDIPNEILSKAVKKLLLESKFLPSIAEVVDASKSLMGTADDSTRVREWDEAWNEIERAMQSTPWGHTPVFSRIEIELAVRSFGWHGMRRGIMIRRSAPPCAAPRRRLIPRRRRRPVMAWTGGKSSVKSSTEPSTAGGAAISCRSSPPFA